MQQGVIMINATSLLKLYARYRLAKLGTQNYAQQQEVELLKLIKKALATRFGKEYAFSTIKSVSDYQNRVPLRYYEDFWKEYWKPTFPRLRDCTWPGTIPFFPVSSGTTAGTTKFIPCSKEMLRSNTKAALDLLVFHLQHKPNSQIFGGKSFVLGGSTDLSEQAPGIFSGDLSGIVTKTIPWWIKARYFPDQELALLKNWEEKIDLLARLSVKEKIKSLSGVPSWLLILFDKLCSMHPDKPKKLSAFYPELELLIHGGVNFAPYRQQFEEITAGSNVDLREVYPASEGFIAVADRNYGEGLRLNLDHDMFFEFVPVDELKSTTPTRHWVGNIEMGINYAVVLTTCAGLWSYVIGDTVRFVDLNPPRLLVTGRTAYYLSAFGEHLLAEEIDDAVTTAARSIAGAIVDYSVGPLFPNTPKELGGHIFVVEFKDSSLSRESLQQFSQVLDKRLCQRNEDYEAHRADGYGLNPPKVVIVKPGTFAAWMKNRGKLGGQNKVPRIINDQTLLTDLREFVQNKMLIS